MHHSVATGWMFFSGGVGVVVVVVVCCTPFGLHQVVGNGKDSLSVASWHTSNGNTPYLTHVAAIKCNYKFKKKTNLPASVLLLAFIRPDWLGHSLFRCRYKNSGSA